MLFSHVPETGGCEWHNGIERFARQFNSKHETKYKRTKCLDVEGGGSGKMPEVLLEAKDSPSMVVERKVVAWPAHYCRNHNELHGFADEFPTCLRAKSDCFNGSPFKLTIHMDSFGGMTKREIRSLPEELARQIHVRASSAKGVGGIRGDQPINWHFGPADPTERGEPASSCGIWVETEGGLYHDWGPEDIEVTDEESLIRLVESRNRKDEVRKSTALRGFAGNLEKAMEDAEGKFAEFDGYKKILLVSFVGDSSNGILDEDLIELVRAAKLPKEIDHVWGAVPDWISAWDYEVSWQYLR